MSCPFSEWKRGYYCIKKDERVYQDIYDCYCKGYRYGDCPIYKYER